MILAILGSLGGVVAFTAGIWIIARAIIRQADAVRDNTDALKANTEAIDKLDKRVDQHDVRIAILERRRTRLVRQAADRPARRPRGLHRHPLPRGEQHLHFAPPPFPVIDSVADLAGPLTRAPRPLMARRAQLLAR